jgi:hypothetical protein
MISQLPEKTGDLKAVMVWIHGGAFKLGTGSNVMYGPDHLLEEDVVIVTIQYRIGILGQVIESKTESSYQCNIGYNTDVKYTPYLEWKWICRTGKTYQRCNSCRSVIIIVIIQNHYKAHS